MKKKIRSIVTIIFLFSAILSATGCSKPYDIVAFPPSQITASWSGTATGDPADRTNTKSNNWLGNMCPPNNVELKNYSDGNVLTITNGCDETNTFYICVTQGSPAQPTDGLQECASNPLDTSTSYLTVEALAAGDSAFINSTQEISINIFYCSSSQTLIGEPLYGSPLKCM